MASSALLTSVLAPKQIKEDPESLQIWGKDWTNGFVVAPSAVVFPESLDQLQDLVAYARTHQLKLVPSGGRTGLSGGAVASQGEVVVSFDRMNKILDFSAKDRIVTCQPGVITANLQAFAEEQGLYYPVDFASSGSSQIGGNVATNAGGIKVIRYGLTRDWVAGMKVVTGSGALLDCNAGLIKNATGYDFRHLMIGSEGTLGLIGELDMHLAPQPEPQTVMVVGVPSVVDLLDILHAFSGKLTLSAFEFFSDLALQKVQAHRKLPAPLANRVDNYALLEFDESELAKAEEAFALCMEEGWLVDGVISQSQAQAAALWQLREGISESLAPYTPYKNDLSVRISEVPGFLADVDRYVNEGYPDFEVCWYGHIGDGNLHYYLFNSQELSSNEFYNLREKIKTSVYDITIELDGSYSAEHGIGLAKKSELTKYSSQSEIALMQLIKKTLDSKNIMNPGKIL